MDVYVDYFKGIVKDYNMLYDENHIVWKDFIEFIQT